VNNDKKPSLLDVLVYGTIASWGIDSLRNSPKNSEPDPWPLCYGSPFRLLAGMATVQYINFLLENLLGMPSGYFSLLWGFLLAFVPILGSVPLAILCLVLISLGVPEGKAMKENAKEHCATLECIQQYKEEHNIR
jgi:hypothetical protein